MKQVIIISILCCLFPLKGFTTNHIHINQYTPISSVMLIQQQTVSEEAVQDTADEGDGHFYGIWIWFMVLGGGLAYMVIFFITSLLSNRKRIKQEMKNKADKKN